MAAAVAVVALAACGAGQAASPATAPPTVGEIGDLPAELSGAAPAPATSTPATSTTAPPTTALGSTAAVTPGPSGPYEGPIGRQVAGNRVLVIGDSIMASISARYGGQLCDRLVPLGWAVEVDAESGRDVTFGLDVLDARLDAGWDAAVIMLGNNYRDDPQEFADDLGELVRRLAPRPTVLLTVTEFQSSRAEVNYVVRALGREHDHVTVVEWARRTADAEELLGADGLHLSEAGRVALADLIAMALNRVAGAGVCLDSEYDDDSLAPDVYDGSDTDESGTDDSGTYDPGDSDDGDGGDGGDDDGAAPPTEPPADTTPVTDPPADTTPVPDPAPVPTDPPAPVTIAGPTVP